MGFFDMLRSLFGGVSGGGDYYERLFGLDPGETVLAGGAGYFDPDPDLAMQALDAVATVLSGRLVRSVGEQFTFVLTDRGRLGLGQFGGRASDSMLFGPQNPAEIIDTGAFGDRGLIGPSGREERTKVLVVRPSQGQPFRIIVPESGADQLLSFVMR